jgi:hypothetical protein
MPFSASFRARGASWIQRELPPSMTTSPSPRSPVSSSITGSTTLSGTITHTTCGALSICSTIAARLSASESSGLVS